MVIAYRAFGTIPYPLRATHVLKFAPCLSNYRPVFFSSALENFYPRPGENTTQGASAREVLTRNEVRNVLEKADQSPGSGNRKPCVKWTPEQRAKIGKRAHKHGISSALKHFAGEYPNLKKQTVFEFKKAYEKLKSSQLKLTQKNVDGKTYA